MTITFNGPLRGRLRKELVKTLQELTISRGHLQVRPLAELAGRMAEWLKKDGHVSLERVIGEQPELIGMYCLISEEIAPQVDALDVDEAKLVDLEAYKDTEAAADRILALFESLPLSYQGVLRLPAELARTYRANGWADVRSEKVAIVGSWEADSSKFPALPGDSARGGALYRALVAEGQRSVDAESLGLHLMLEGFVSEVLTTLSVESALGTVKSLFGLFIATGICRPLGLPGILNYAPEMEIYRVGETDSRLRSEHIDGSDASLLNSMVFLKRTDDLTRKMEQIISLVNQTSKPEPLVLAGRWLFESYANRDTVMAFMQAAIVLEVLLGGDLEREGVGVTSLLANRCAYMLAESRQEREAIAKSFRAIYETRSRIVHAGTTRLTMEQRSQYHALQRLCDRVIHAELHLMRDERARNVESLAAALRNAR